MRQTEHDTLSHVLHVGCVSDDEGVGESSRSSKLNVGTRLDFGHFGSNCTHNVTAHPCSLLRALLLDGFSHGVRVSLAALDAGVEAYAVVNVAKQKLPCATVVAENTHHATYAKRKNVALEVGIVAVAHDDGVARILVLEVAACR